MTSTESLEDPVILKIKRFCAKRGNNGIRSLVQSFRKGNAEADAKLTFAQFAARAQACQLQLTDHEVRHLAIAFDSENDGLISLSEFLASFAVGLPPRRKFALERVWASFNHDGDGNAALEEVINRFNASNHPLVRTGELSHEVARENFQSHFTRETNPLGLVTKEEFIAFYAGISQSIPDDDYFENRMYSVWDIEPVDASMTTSYGTVRAAWEAGRSSPTYSATARKAPGYSAPLQKCYAVYSHNSRNYDTSHLQTKKGKGLTHTLPTELFNPPTFETTYRTSYPPPTAQDLQLTKPALPYGRKAELAPAAGSEADELIRRIRELVTKKGGKGGVRGLTRVLRIMDDNGNKMLDKYELQNGLQTYGLTLTSAEMDKVMAIMDADGSGQISVEEFLYVLRGPMPEKRLQLVQQAYMLLDAGQGEAVTFAEMRQLVDMKRHPEVVRREKTTSQALQEFVSGWDKQDDSVVTWADFLDFYADISAGIPNDDDFELLMRSIWHISGGTGKFSTVSRRRVLVTHMNGTQSLHEIVNDLRIGPEDTDLMLENLRMQQVKDIKKISPVQ
eukprot:GGOE01053753.1.p1 GENE.GGOE01053753.1~~GGOE01053753.1.p1  ORF type:complete len:563 (+),score=170.46 GGOE01053753.1:102-1790(+)